MEHLVDPAIADLQAEYEEASRWGPGWRTCWIWTLGHIAFFKLIVVHALGTQLRAVLLDFRLGLRLLALFETLPFFLPLRYTNERQTAASADTKRRSKIVGFNE